MERLLFDLVLFSLLLPGGCIAIVVLGIFLDEGPSSLSAKFIAIREILSTSWFYNAACLRRKLIIAVTLSTVGIAALYCWFEPPVYSATCVIKDGEPSPFLSENIHPKTPSSLIPY